jgi:uncharacterized protein (DUF983 family)
VPDQNISADWPVRWQSGALASRRDDEGPALLTALARGFVNRCPACGKGHVFRGYLTVAASCSQCGAPLGRLSADDAPPYFTIFATGHIIVPLMFLVERAHPPIWVNAAIFLPLTVVVAVGLLRPIKGATVGLMLRLGMFKPDGE